MKSANLQYRLMILVLFAFLVFLFSAILAKNGVSELERNIFMFFNSLPEWLHWPLWAFSQLATLGSVIIIAIASIIKRQKLLAAYILLGGILSYAFAYALKLLDFRARPGALLPEAVVRECSNATLGYPSGHAAVATILCLTLMLFLPKKWRPYLVSLALLVGVSRMYLGVHLPLDLVGGFAVGCFVFAVIYFLQLSVGFYGYKHLIPKKLLQNVNYRSLLLLLVLSLAVIFIMSRYDDFRISLQSIKNASPLLVILAILFSFATYFFASISYEFLSRTRIKFSKMFVIQIASSFASKLLPAGTGGLALNTRFLSENNHTVAQSASIAVINNIMGFVGHLSLLFLVILFGQSSIDEAFNFDVHLSPLAVTVLIAVAIIAIIIVAALDDLRQKMIDVLSQVKESFTLYRNKPSKLLGSYIASIFITLSYVGALYASAQGLGADLSPLQVLVVFTVGAAAASVTPTPGGIGGVEAALVASLTATGVDASQAIAITLLYRFATYWLPMIPGFIAFQYSVKRKYI